MENKNKDKIIIGLVIVIAILFANNFAKSKPEPLLTESKSLLDSDENISLDEKANDVNLNENQEMKVHISGEIRNEGVYTIENGERLDDLVKRAGGFNDLADTKNINLAMKLEDQMKIYIPNINEKSENDTNIQDLSSDNTNSSKVNINLATKEELMTLPNVGEKRADAIIEYREMNKFEKIEDIKNVTGIGDKFFEAMKELISV